MKLFRLFTFSAWLLIFVACGKPVASSSGKLPREVPRQEAAKADNAASEAVFAHQLRDYPRAIQSLETALALRKDIPDWWELLARCHLASGDKKEARKAYKRALSLWNAYYEQTRDPRIGLQEVVTMLYLGRDDEAAKLLETLVKNHPEDHELRILIGKKGIEYLLADPDVRSKRL